MSKGKLQDDDFDKSVRSGISGPLDKAFGWGYDNPREESKVRGAIHGVYHTFQGVKEWCRGNNDNSSRQFDRAGEQFKKGW